MTGTTGTGDDVKLTPLNLFLVSITLPDIPVADPEPEPALDISSWVVVTKQRNSLGGSDVFIYRHEGDTIVLDNDFRLPNGCGSDSRGWPAFSPDNSQLAIAHAGSCFNGPELTLFSFSDGVATKTDGKDMGTQGVDCSWSLDGSFIASTVGVNHPFNMPIHSVSAGLLTRVAEYKTDSTQGSVSRFSPAAQNVLLYADNRPTTDSGDNLFALDFDGSALTVIDSIRPRSSSIEAGTAAWNSAGNQIAISYTSDARLVRVGFDGSELTVLEDINVFVPGGVRGCVFAGDDQIALPHALYKIEDSAMSLAQALNSNGRRVTSAFNGRYIFVAENELLQLWKQGNDGSYTVVDTAAIGSGSTTGIGVSNQ